VPNPPTGFPTVTLQARSRLAKVAGNSASHCTPTAPSDSARPRTTADTSGLRTRRLSVKPIGFGAGILTVKIRVPKAISTGGLNSSDSVLRPRTMAVMKNWARVARGQGGIVRRDQLSAIGYSYREVDRLISSGAVVATVHPGVYRAAGAPATEEAATWLAVLGCRAVLSYVSAARHWELPVAADGQIHITRFDRSRFRPSPLLRVHRTLLVPGATTDRWGLEVTTRTETLLDCLGWLPLPAARTLLDRAMQQSWLSEQLIRRRLDEQSGRWGNRQLRRLLDQTLPGAEAESERRVHRILHAAGITGWTPNLAIVLDGLRFRLDLAFEAAKVAIEVEGWAFHRDKDRRDRDLAKLNALARHGWILITFNWEHTEDPDYICRSVLTVLAQRS
jgi:putative AbiEi antitoxin of type IV toxin-antitoxin system